jgi:hypothetical protein
LTFHACQTYASVGRHSMSSRRTFWSGSFTNVFHFPRRFPPSFLFRWDKPSRPYFEIIRNPSQKSRVAMTAHHTVIAIIAQKSANLTRLVVMIDRQFDCELALVLEAYRTLPVLPSKKLVILFEGNPVETTKMSFTGFRQPSAPSLLQSARLDLLSRRTSSVLVRH